MDLSDLTWQERALAAERTVAVLKKRLQALDSGSAKSLNQRILEITHRRTVARGRPSQHAPPLVPLDSPDTRTQVEAIHSILDHNSVGFLFVGADLRIRARWSASCEALLRQNKLHGRFLPEVLGWSDELTIEFELMMSQAFDGTIPQGVSLDQLPARATLGGRELRLSYRAQLEDGQTTAIAVTIVDLTAQLQLKRSIRDHLRLVNVVLQRDAFVAFLAESRSRFRQSLQALHNGDPTPLQQTLHAVKDRCASFLLDDVAALCRHLLDNRPLDTSAGVLVLRALNRFVATNQRTLAIPPEADDSLLRLAPESKTTNTSSENAMTSSNNQGQQPGNNPAQGQPAGQLLAPIQEAAKRWSDELSKDVEFVITGQDVVLDHNHLAPVLKCIPHLVRNAIVYGIEFKSNRPHKPGPGKVEVGIIDQGNHIELFVEDDGKGIDSKAVGATAERRSLLPHEQSDKLSTDQAFNLLTTEGFSSTTDLSDSSGKGVGLSAVRQAVEQLNGQLTLKSSPGEGSRFTITIPKLAQAS